MKICIFTETYYPVVGGGETQAKLLAEALINKDNTVFIITRRSDKGLQKFEKYGNLSVYRLSPTGRGQLKKWGLIFSSIPVLIHLRGQYDLIFVSGFRIIGITAILISKLFHKKCVLKADSLGEMSGAFFFDGLKKFKLSPNCLLFKIFLIMRNKVLSKADSFTAIYSDISAEISISGIRTERIRIIPNSVDTKLFYPVTSEQKITLREKLKLPKIATIAIYTGRLVSYKGLPLLLKTWQELVKKHNNILLLLVGTGGLDVHNCEAELQNFVAVNELEKDVIFIGSVHNVYEYLQASDFFIFPTENDAFPSSLLEAMACALPIVTTPVGAIKNIITDNQNGILIQPGDYDMLYGAIDNLLSDKKFASLLGKNAVKTVGAIYAIETVSSQYLSLFQSVVNQTAI